MSVDMDEINAKAQILVDAAPPFSESQRKRIRAIITAARTTARLRNAA